jgi:hypothetical protein
MRKQHPCEIFNTGLISTRHDILAPTKTQSRTTSTVFFLFYSFMPAPGRLTIKQEKFQLLDSHEIKQVKINCSLTSTS